MSKHHKEMYTEMEALEARCAAEAKTRSAKPATSRALLQTFAVCLLVAAFAVQPALLPYFVACFILSNLSEENK